MPESEKIEIIGLDELDERYANSDLYRAGCDAVKALSEEDLLATVDGESDSDLVVAYSEDGQTLTLQTSAETVEVLAVSDETARVFERLSGGFLRFLKQ